MNNDETDEIQKEAESLWIGNDAASRMGAVREGPGSGYVTRYQSTYGELEMGTDGKCWYTRYDSTWYRWPSREKAWQYFKQMNERLKYLYRLLG